MIVSFVTFIVVETPSFKAGSCILATIVCADSLKPVVSIVPENVAPLQTNPTGELAAPASTSLVAAWPASSHVPEIAKVAESLFVFTKLESLGLVIAIRGAAVSTKTALVLGSV